MWEVFKDFIFQIIQFFHGPLGDWGMSIIVVTIIFRVLISPLMHKQTKSSYQMQKFQPKIKAIQDKYANDSQRLQEETQKLYAEAHFNPLAGCLPMLFQMPIFIALFQVLNEMGTRIGESDYSFYNIVPDLVISPSIAFPNGFGTFLPYLVLMLLFAGATFAPMVLMQMGQKDNPQRNQTLIMSAVMSVFMLFISWTSPAGVLLFWGVSSLIGVAQQQVSMRIMKQRDVQAAEETIDVQPVEVDVVRKPKKKRPTKKR